MQNESEKVELQCPLVKWKRYENMMVKENNVLGANRMINVR